MPDHRIFYSAIGIAVAPCIAWGLAVYAASVAASVDALAFWIAK